MESIYTELDLYGSKKSCAKTDTVLLPISEVCDGTVSLTSENFLDNFLIFFLNLPRHLSGESSIRRGNKLYKMKGVTHPK